MSLVIRVIAPFGRDAELIVEVLRHAGLVAEVCEDLQSLLSRLGDQSIGPLLIAEETLHTAAIEQLGQLIKTPTTVVGFTNSYPYGKRYGCGSKPSPGVWNGFLWALPFFWSVPLGLRLLSAAYGPPFELASVSMKSVRLWRN